MAGYYATQADIDNLYGANLLIRIADKDKDGVPDQEIVDAGLAAADDIIDGYVGAVATLPLSPVPGLLRRCAIDIAIYSIALGRTERTDEMRVRYDDALCFLDKIGKGLIALVQNTGSGSGGSGGSTTTTTNDEKRLGRSVSSYRS
jgi:phage gp36-like protein